MSIEHGPTTFQVTRTPISRQLVPISLGDANAPHYAQVSKSCSVQLVHF